MKIETLRLPEIKVIRPRVFEDARGCFFETFQAKRYSEAGIPALEGATFVQDNVSWSKKGVVRGLHWQKPTAQGKLVFPLDGEILDVAVDVRVGSPTFGQHVSVLLSSEKQEQIWVPVGFAHGFVVLSERARVMYKCTDYYDPKAERGILWNDPALGIDWGVDRGVLSPKDEVLPRLAEAPREHLFRFGG